MVATTVFHAIMFDDITHDDDVLSTAPDQGKILLAVSILTNVIALWTCVVRIFVNRADKRETHWCDRFVGLAMVRTTPVLFPPSSLTHFLSRKH